MIRICVKGRLDLVDDAHPAQCRRLCCGPGQGAGVGNYLIAPNNASAFAIPGAIID